MATQTGVSPYATALALGRPKPTHVEDGFYNIDRISAYSTYADIWANIPDAFAALLRNGDDPKARRYIPLVRGLVEGINRYLAKDPEIVWTPIPGATVTQDDMDAFTAQVNATLTREEFDIKFLAMKRWWLIKGDSLLALSADPSKEQGTRLRITEIPAEQYFPVHDPNDGERVIGCYLTSIVQDDDDDNIVQRIEYWKCNTQDRADQFGVSLGAIFYRLGFFELDGWDDRPDVAADLKPVEPPQWAAAGVDPEADPFTGYALPASITSLPVYHFRNQRRGGIEGRYGTSEIQGLESILAGAIQNSTDEDMAIALLGIGVYTTDSGRPRDARGNEADWEMGPGTVLELEKDSKFNKVDGVTTVQPIQDHMTHLRGAAREAAAIPDIAAGTVDPNSTASGVALSIQFMPVLARNSEKEAELNSKLTQFLYDMVTMWFPAYEQITPPQVSPSLTFGNPLPLDRAAALKEIIDMVTANVVSREWAATAISERLGYTFPKNMQTAIVSEQSALLDASGARIAADAGTDPNADPTVA
jgi:hypothetical protein